MLGNGTMADPALGGSPEWHLPHWFEPVVVSTLLACSMIGTRRRGFKIFGGKNYGYHPSTLDDPDYADSSADLLAYDAANIDEVDGLPTTAKHPPKNRSCCGAIIQTPNSSRFARYYHSRILQKFPFLVEMFYWIVTWGCYNWSKDAAEILYSNEGIRAIAQKHALSILWLEQDSWARFFFPIHEIDVQNWLLNGHDLFLTLGNRIYALVHVPGTVAFIAWYYYVAPSHNTFAVVRRTLTLTNFTAFFIFTLYPVMPPRFLPQEYGFLDTVHRADVESVWMSGRYANLLAAMPSMHFGYASCIGCTMIYHSGFLRRRMEPGEVRKGRFWQLLYLAFGVCYPLFILFVIIGSANHYWLDVIAAAFVVIFSFLCNRIFLIFLPLEDLLLWVLRLEKPIPSTGERYRKRGGRL